ncbi:MAG: GSCFA domain-containing protein [Novosphingobium sp.]|jgi:hypothetical protein
MGDHPYATAPAHNFWRKSVASCDTALVDPVVNFPFKINHETKVATAGSCFAQHIARYLKDNGYNYYVTEPGHPLLPDSIKLKNNYGLFSARYGNIYTTRQLLQLVQRAYGAFSPIDDVWQCEDGSILDPFRPSAQPGGYISELEMRLDRRQHLSAVREMFENLDVFVFTLGLTECWVSRFDGAVYPICPGVEGGEFSEERYQFHNQSINEIVEDLTQFVVMLAIVNPKAEIILTVSPVPLAATARKDCHVLTATTYSKSVLRVAAETIAMKFEHIAYFPSYEIITGSFNRGSYFADDLRNVLEAGVSHVMRLFLKHATGVRVEGPECNPAKATETVETETSQTRSVALAQQLVEVECDEARLDNS